MSDGVMVVFVTKKPVVTVVTVVTGSGPLNLMMGDQVVRGVPRMGLNLHVVGERVLREVPRVGELVSVVAHTSLRSVLSGEAKLHRVAEVLHLDLIYVVVRELTRGENGTDLFGAVVVGVPVETAQDRALTGWLQMFDRLFGIAFPREWLLNQIEGWMSAASRERVWNAKDFNPENAKAYNSVLVSVIDGLDLEDTVQCLDPLAVVRGPIRAAAKRKGFMVRADG